MCVKIEKIDKVSDNSKEQNESQKVYAAMARMYSNVESHRRDFRNRSQPTNWILDSSANFPMTPYISDFVLRSLVEMDKYIEVTDGFFVTAKQTVEVQIYMCDDDVKTFITVLYHLTFAPDFCD